MDGQGKRDRDRGQGCVKERDRKEGPKIEKKRDDRS